MMSSPELPENKLSLILYQQTSLQETIRTVWTRDDHSLHWFFLSQKLSLSDSTFAPDTSVDGRRASEVFCLHWVVGSLQITCCDECLCCTRGTMVMALVTVCWGVLSLPPPLPGNLGFSCHQAESRGSRKQWDSAAAIISEEQHRLILFGRNLKLQIALIKLHGLWEWMVLWREEMQEGRKCKRAAKQEGVQLF